MPRPSGDRVRSCRTCDYWCPMHGERRQYATLGVCAKDGELMEHDAVCSRYSAPAQRDVLALVSQPCWKRAPEPGPQTVLAL